MPYDRKEKLRIRRRSRRITKQCAKTQVLGAMFSNEMITLHTCTHTALRRVECDLCFTDMLPSLPLSLEMP
jgi:hypothetical protein